ncbi:hypothetical protein G3V96_28750 [Escherichia coli]|nr:hypothetical protein [Escherichia coli]
MSESAWLELEGKVRKYQNSARMARRERNKARRERDSARKVIALLMQQIEKHGVQHILDEGVILHES